MPLKQENDRKKNSGKIMLTIKPKIRQTTFMYDFQKAFSGTAETF